MNYELAKELMDAGFPQGGSGDWVVDPNAVVVRSGERVYAPTLSELIEACGERFAGLDRLADRTWAARTIDYSNDWGHEHGSTSEEAVARLWLALNQPKKAG
jgi:hypothetical protein